MTSGLYQLYAIWNFLSCATRKDPGVDYWFFVCLHLPAAGLDLKSVDVVYSQLKRQERYYAPFRRQLLLHKDVVGAEQLNSFLSKLDAYAQCLHEWPFTDALIHISGDSFMKNAFPEHPELLHKALLNSENTSGIVAYLSFLKQELITGKEVVYTDQILPIPDIQLLPESLGKFQWSASSLNTFMNCRISFYYDYVIRAPRSFNISFLRGAAVHFALEQFYRTMQASPAKTFPDAGFLKYSFDAFIRRNISPTMQEAHKEMLEQAKENLIKYYENYSFTLNRIAIVEVNFVNERWRNIPVQGKVDKLEFTGKDLTLVDYKTGQIKEGTLAYLEAPNEKNPSGGNYWRQMQFYKLLVDSSTLIKERSWNLRNAYFDFVDFQPERAGFERLPVTYDAASQSAVAAQLTESHQALIHMEPGLRHCGLNTCEWCNYLF